MLVSRTSLQRPPPTSPGRPLNILFDYPGDVLIWSPGDLLKWCPGDVLIWRSRDVPGRLIRDVGPHDVLRTSSRGLSKYSNLDASRFLLTFLSECIQLTKSIQKHFNTQGLLRTSQTSKMELVRSFLRN